MVTILLKKFLLYVIVPLNTSDSVVRSIFFTGLVLASPMQRQPLVDLIRDDDVALEETEYIELELIVHADDHCLVNVHPFNTTTIVVTDDDGKMIYSCIVRFLAILIDTFSDSDYCFN